MAQPTLFDGVSSEKSMIPTALKENLQVYRTIFFSEKSARKPWFPVKMFPV
jgi:hypothetical protein